MAELLKESMKTTYRNIYKYTVIIKNMQVTNKNLCFFLNLERILYGVWSSYLIQENAQLFFFFYVMVHVGFLKKIIFKKGSQLRHYQLQFSNVWDDEVCGVDVCGVLRGVYTFIYNLKLVEKCFKCALFTGILVLYD